MSKEVILPTVEDGDILVTYKKTIRFGPYGDSERKEVVTERGFVSTITNSTVSIPPSWQYFNGLYLPHGFGGVSLPFNKIISWTKAEPK